ncbi:MAG: DinB family protein [Ignavibacteria bacterium]|nr:DinB family protein [Ignavibacteria bacterium]
MSNSIKQLINQFNLHTRLFNNVTVAIKDGDAAKPMNENTNHIAWLTGHTVSTRFTLAGALGLKESEPFAELFQNGKGIDKTANYPAMNELTKDWNGLSTKIASALNLLNEETLNVKMPRPVPTGDTLSDFISFLMHHEAYTLGQLGIYRRYYGVDAMKYD